MRPLGLVLSASLVALSVSACSGRTNNANNLPPGQFPPGQLPPAGYYQQGMGPLPPVYQDPISDMNLNWLQSRAGEIMTQLTQALPPDKKSLVTGIPFLADPAVGDVNAYAGCDDQRQPMMAITDALLEVIGYISQFRAIDELNGSQRMNEYTSLLAAGTKPKEPLPKPGPVEPQLHTDGRKVLRQHVIFDEMVAFVLGHELGHHYLGHTGCATGQGGGRVSAGDLGRIAARVPLFNQANEFQADVAGTNNLLAAGLKQQPYQWTENGALLTLNFFAQIDQLTPATILFGFKRTHPPPLLRLPVVQSAARTWRQSGGVGWQFPNPFGI